VNVGRKANFSGQGYTPTGNGRAIGLLNGKLKVGLVDDICDFLAQFREEFGNHVVTGKPLAIFGLEELLADYAVCVYEEVSGARHAVELPSGFSVQYLISPNDFGIGIREQGEIDFAAIRKVFQYGFAIVTERRQFESLLFESCFRVLQLDQLPFAIGSPIG
jgi:hypothetical protein